VKKISKADQARELFNQGYNISAASTMVGMNYSHAMTVHRAWEKTSSQEILINADLNRNNLRPQSREQFEMFFHNKDWSKLRECVASKATTIDAKETILDNYWEGCSMIMNDPEEIKERKPYIATRILWDEKEQMFYTEKQSVNQIREYHK